MLLVGLVMRLKERKRGGSERSFQDHVLDIDNDVGVGQDLFCTSEIRVAAGNPWQAPVAS